MPVQGERSVAICRQCESALAVRILADGSIRPIGTGTTCSCGGDAFDVIDAQGSNDDVDEDGLENDDRRRIRP